MHSYFDEITTDRQAHGGIAGTPSGQTTTCGFQRTPPCALIGTLSHLCCWTLSTSSLGFNRLIICSSVCNVSKNTNVQCG